jgi:hypothetical protein
MEAVAIVPQSGFSYQLNVTRVTHSFNVLLLGFP